MDQRYNLSEFYDNPDDIHLRVAIRAASDEAKCNPTYGQPIARTLPTSVRFGLKVGF